LPDDKSWKEYDLNEQLYAVLQIAGGFVALVFGGEMLVRGASTLATMMRISPLVIGLTVVAFGTSSPELGVSLRAAWTGSADVAVGNIVGSNIFNVLFILGVSALVTPLVVSSQLIRYDVPLMIGVSIVAWWLARDFRLDRTDGLVLFSALIGYLILCFRNSRRESKGVQDEFAREYGSRLSGETAGTSSDIAPRLALQIGLIVGGLVCLGLGSKWLVGGAVSLASWFGVSQLIIGLTIVAIGTSLPEVVTSVVASFRGERDIAVGNVVGSNIFNLACVLGISSLIAPGGVSVTGEAIHFDMPVMIAVALGCFPVFFTGLVIARWEGCLFLVYYTAYTALLILRHTNAQVAGELLWVIGYIVIPITLITLSASLVSSLASAKRAKGVDR
jgi:cation:H+ antiporter